MKYTPAIDLAPLEARSITRRYGGAAVVDNVSLTLHPGEVTALLGASGAGKSTLLRLFAGLEPVETGEIASGETVWSRPGKTVPPERRRIGMVFQDFALFPHLNVRENIRFGLPGMTRDQSDAVISGWLDRVGLSSRASAYPHELSGGEQQRVAIARALAPSPVALLMDEPFSGLDPVLRDDVRHFTLSVVRETGVPALLVTHDPEDGMRHAHRVAIMRAGRIVQCDRPEKVYFNPVDRLAAAALGPVFEMASAKVENGKINTLYGAFPTDLGDGTDALVLLREGGLRVDAAGTLKGTVERTEFAGTTMEIIVRIYDRSFSASAPAHSPRPEAGATVKLAVDPNRVVIVPV